MHSRFAFALAAFASAISPASFALRPSFHARNALRASFYILLLLLAGCKGAKPAAVTYAPDNIVPTDKSLLWRISGKGLKQPSYLFGTIHLIPREDLVIDPGVWTALEKCKKITFEIDMREMTSMRTQFSLITKAFMKNDTTIKDLLSAEDYKYVHSKLEEKGLASKMFERMKPMFLSMMLESDGEDIRKEDSKMTSVEMELWRTAKKRKMKSGGLETAAYQMAVFDAIPYKAQAEMLMDGLRNTSEADSQLKKMIEMYKQQDIEAMQSMMQDESEGLSDYEDLFLGRRNRNWIPLMSDIMAAQPTFFAVGAGHLGGKGGVVALLRNEGFTVEAVK